MSAIAANPAPTRPAPESFALGIAAPVKGVSEGEAETVLVPAGGTEMGAGAVMSGTLEEGEELGWMRLDETRVMMKELHEGVGVAVDEGVTMMGVLVVVGVGVEVVEVCTVTVTVVVRVEVMDSISPAAAPFPPFATEARAGLRAAAKRVRVLKNCILCCVVLVDMWVCSRLLEYEV
ncbi:uncharacterized protein BDV14DRAFT_184567 [Aspergillus stella-maris]|uniref:uncharacterized protein n=1 Tax=Aspergillus stella-maris TaxID=1810926 RepID=UPI003CCE247E